MNQEEPEFQVAYMSTEWINGYCHIKYANHMDKEMKTHVMGARKGIVISDWKSHGD